jgi:hypothetical protein
MRKANSYLTQTRGETHGKSKLNDDKVRRIRGLHKKGMPGNMLALLFGVAHATIHQVIHGKTWKHIT